MLRFNIVILLDFRESTFLQIYFTVFARKKQYLRHIFLLPYRIFLWKNNSWRNNPQTAAAPGRQAVLFCNIVLY